MAFCLLPDQIENFRKALKEKDIKIADLLHMSSEQRTELLKKYAGENAHDVNTAFEEKLVLKNQIAGAKNWFNKLTKSGRYSEEAKLKFNKDLAEYKQKKLKRILSPEAEESFLNDLADKQIGTHVTRGVAGEIFKRTEKLKNIKEKNANMSGVSDDFLKESLELQDYIKSLTPLSTKSSIGKNLLLIGRNNLLFNPSTPLKVIANNFTNSVADMISRRLARKSINGSSSDLVTKAYDEAQKTYKKTGLNTASMESLDDTNIMGKGENFKTPNISEKSNSLANKYIEPAIRNVAKLSNSVVIDFAHNLPFVKFYQKTFFDSANINASDFVKKLGASGEEAKIKARDIFKDAVKIEPQTPEGRIVRQQAQKQAAIVTSTNDTFASKFSLGAKKTLNSAIDGVPLGDFIIPMAKIPSSVIANAIHNAGAGIPKGVIDFYKGYKNLQSSDPQIKANGAIQYAQGLQNLLKIGGTIGTSLLLASSLKKDDFKSDNFGNHYVKIGNNWINTQYFELISPALAGVMTVKEKGDKKDPFAKKVFQYSTGVLSSLKHIPGVDEVYKLVNSVTNSDYNKGILKYIKDFGISRALPSFARNLTKDRVLNRLLFGAHGVENDQDVKNDKKEIEKLKREAKHNK